MAKSAGDVLTSARYTLNDAAKRRLPDAEGLTYLSSTGYSRPAATLQQLRRVEHHA